MAIDDNFEVKITSTFQGDVMMNVLHYQQIGGVGGITECIGSLVLAVAADVIAKMALAQSDKVSYQTVRVQQVGVANPNIQKDALILGGDREEDPLPGQDAVLFVKRCNTGGRANVGKFYLGAVPDVWAVGGEVTVGQDELEAVALQLKTNISNGGRTFAPIIWHRQAQTAEFVTAVNIRKQISRQNRRHLPIY